VASRHSAEVRGSSSSSLLAIHHCVS
jgi:hypothetical protein